MNIPWKFCEILYIIHGDIKENVSGCFFEHSVHGMYKTGTLKTRDWKHGTMKNAEVKNAEPENVGPSLYSLVLRFPVLRFPSPLYLISVHFAGSI